MDLFGIGPLQFLMIAIVALIVLGPEKLPHYARQAGKYMRQFRKITSGITQEINRALELDELEGVGDSVGKELKEISRSLEEDAALLKQSLSEGASSLEKTVNKGVEEVREGLEKGSADITSSMNESTKSPKSTVADGMGEARSGGISDPQEAPVGHVSPGALVDYVPPPLPVD